LVKCPYCQSPAGLTRDNGFAVCSYCLQRFDLDEGRESNCGDCGGPLYVPGGAGSITCERCGKEYSMDERGVLVGKVSDMFLPESSSSYGGPEEETYFESSQANAPIDKQVQRLNDAFAENYEILEFMGRGGMGAVYKARQKKPDRVVVLKVLDRSKWDSQRDRLRFEREAQAVARLKHPNVVAVYEFGELNGQPYFTMEYVEGKTLKQHVRHNALDKVEICQLILAVIRAIGYAHLRGVIHRDLKPDNIMVDLEGRPRILDFGLARLAMEEGEESLARLTETGEIMGTPAYMSPEQTFARPDEVDTRTDIYSVGVILYELLAGQSPYQLDPTRPLETLYKIREVQPDRPSAVNSHLDGDMDAIILKAIEKDKESRYQSARELADDLERYLNSEPVAARDSTKFYELRKLMWRYRRLVAPVLSAAVAVTAVSGVFIWRLAASKQLAERNAAQAEQARVQSEEDQQALMTMLVKVEGLRDTINARIDEGHWAEAYRIATIAEGVIPSEAEAQGLKQSVRQRIAEAVFSSGQRIYRLTEDMQLQEARGVLAKLESAVEGLDLPELQQQVADISTDFDDEAWAACRRKLYREGGSIAVLRSFLSQCPNSPHRQDAQEMLADLAGSIRYTEWPFGPEEAGNRQQRTAQVLGIPVSKPLVLDEQTQLDLVLIPAGEFLMGSSQDEGAPNERPRHRVRIGAPFYIGAREVTVAQYRSVMGVEAGEPEGEAGQTAEQQQQTPVSGVSWYEAVRFCENLSLQLGVAARLPTEAEWEYACRSGARTRFYYEDDLRHTRLKDFAWYSANSGGGPQPVAQKLPNTWDLYDMHGNMLEWCSDWYDRAYYADSPVVSPSGPVSGEYKVLRGGNWSNSPSELRCAYRVSNDPDEGRIIDGFRVVVEIAGGDALLLDAAGRR